jgi:CarS bacterial SH3 domain
MPRAQHRSSGSLKAAPDRAICVDVDGAPFSIGQPVVVCSLADETANRSFLLKLGVVVYFDYECGCGQTYPQDPMIGVRFPNGKVDEFWREELKATRRPLRRVARRDRNRQTRRG